MFTKIRNRHFFALDVMLLPMAAYASYILRLEKLEIKAFWPGYILFAVLATVITTLVFRYLGVYSRYWRYASVNELLLLAGSVTVSAIAAGVLGFLFLWLAPVNWVLPRSIPLIFLLLGLTVTASPRLLVRIMIGNGQRHGQNGPMRKVLIMGAGDAGSMIVREMLRNPNLGLEPVGFVDDDSTKHGMKIHGVPVLGAREDIPALADQFEVQQVVIAMPTASGKTIRKIVAICEKARVKTKIMPGIYELLDGTVSVNQLRDVAIEDLLRREPVRTDTTAVSALLAGKRVLITGGGGSIGSELCRQVLRCRPAEMMLVGHGENSIFAIYHELNQSGVDPAVPIQAVVADIRFPDRITALFKQFRPEIVFHAAAHKHVPLMEMNPTEAITNNVQGTKNLLAAAIAVDAAHFVMISTDKAVNPTSVMGASKRTAELLVHQAAEQTGRPYVAVRFGNVLGSRGSVVLTFEKQIAAGGPVTITDPEMKRYFMTIPEAVQLVLQAATLGTGGEVFVLDMGDPVKIVDLARDLIELSGLEEGRDIDIVFIGARPGEKLFEELFLDGEEYKRTTHEKIFIASNGGSIVSENMDDGVAALLGAAWREDGPGVLNELQKLVPEFDPVRFRNC